MAKTPWASVARIEVDGKHSGTGFLVANEYVLTALHVVADKETGQPFRDIRLFFDTNAEFEDGSKILETEASVAEHLWSIEYDFALLKCVRVPERAIPLRLSDRCQPFDRCSSPGFAIQKPSGFTVSGYVSSLNEPMAGKTAIGVQFDFSSGIKMHGHSGAPLLVRDRVVGLLRTAFEDESEAVVGSIVHSTAVPHVVEVCNRVARAELLSCRATVRWAPVAATQSPLLLADRKPEYELFQRMVTGQSPERVLFLEGANGIGKSTLMEELAKYAGTIGVPVGNADCKGAPQMADLFDSLLLSLPPGLFPATRAAAGEERYSLIVDEMADIGRPVVLQIDTWEDSGDAVQKWMRKAVLPSLDSNPGLIVMIAGQPVDAKTKACQPLLCAERPLQPIKSTADWHDYAIRRWPNTGWSHDHVDALVKVKDGVPMEVATSLDILQRMLRIAPSPGDAL